MDSQKNPFGLIFVIPAKAGIHPAEGGTAFAGVTAFPTFYEIINVDDFLKMRIPPPVAGACDELSRGGDKREGIINRLELLPSSPSPRPSPVKGEGVVLTF
jgi:hypothetical protein